MVARDAVAELLDRRIEQLDNEQEHERPYERKALAGMARTLRDNRGIVQIEVLEARDETIGLMSAAGYALAWEFPPNLVFRKL